MVLDEISIEEKDARTAFMRRFWESVHEPSRCHSGERVMYKYTSVLPGNLDQRWGHGTWVGKAPMTDEHIILTEKWGSESEIVAPRATGRKIRDQ